MRSVGFGGINEISRRIPRVIIHILLITGSIITIFPMAWMFLSAFKPPQEIIQIPPNLFPNEPTLDNFREIFTRLPFIRFVLNSLLVTTLSTMILIFLTSIAGFVFAKYEFIGKKYMYAIILLTMMIADEVLVLPLYLMITRAHLNNTFVALILPFLITGFAVFLMRQFISTIPTELIEAAVVDGASDFRIYRSIIFPLIGPALASLAIFNFVWMWNMFMWPTVAVDTEIMMTLPVALSRFTSMYLTRYDLTMAAASVATIPILIAYLVLQRNFVRGIALTGLKQ